MKAKMKPFVAALALAGLLGAGSAQALTLTMTPVSQTRNLGQSASVDLVVSDLSLPTGGSEIVSAFDLDITFNPAILGSASFALNGSVFGAPDLLEFSDVSGGLITIAMNSFLSDGELLALQGDDVVLGTLSFVGIGLGTSSVSYDFGDPVKEVIGLNATPLSFDSIAGARITIIDGNGGQVPEPGSLALVALAFAAMGLGRHALKRG